MKPIKDKKKDYQKETIFFMRLWILIFSIGLVLDLTDVAFGEDLNVRNTIISVLYLIFFSFGVYFAKKGKMIAGILELIAGVIIILNNLFQDNAIGLYGIIGILIVIHSIMYLLHHKKNN